MKAYTLLFLRITTGLLIAIWGLIKILSPQIAAKVSDKYYGGAISSDALQMPLGFLQALFGVVIILGVFRKVIYPLQSIFLGFGLLAIWKHIFDPLGLYLLTPATSQVLFFPSLTVFAATLILIAFKEDDVISWDAIRSQSEANQV